MSRADNRAHLTRVDSVGESADRSTVWIERLKLHQFRSYAAISLDLGPGPVVLTGPNGAGKTNLLEAISLLQPGPGLRRAPYAEMGRVGGSHDWSVSATVRAGDQRTSIGTGLSPKAAAGDGSGRLVRIEGENRSPTALSDILEVVWLTPSMDGLFLGPAGERRRFIDRLILCFDSGFRTHLNTFERAMRQRNRLLEMGRAGHREFEGLELQMAETAVAIAAARREAVGEIRASISRRIAGKPDSPFPWADIAIDGEIESLLDEHAAVDVEDRYARLLAEGRDRDRAAGRTLQGPHRSDLLVGHGPKQLPAKVCSTGEQKALLINLVLGHAELITRRKPGGAPILLLDEITAHLDDRRRLALFGEIVELGVQAFMTGTDTTPFFPLESRAQFLAVADGIVSVTG